MPAARLAFLFLELLQCRHEKTAREKSRLALFPLAESKPPR
jgi:hypothetical protein